MIGNTVGILAKKYQEQIGGLEKSFSVVWRIDCIWVLACLTLPVGVALKTKVEQDYMLILQIISRPCSLT